MSDLEKAKSYQRIRQRLAFVSLLLTPFTLILTLISPVNGLLLAWAYRVTHPVGQLLLYFLGFSIWMLLFDLPYSYYSGFKIEHKFGLSNQTLRTWGMDVGKRSVLSFLLSLILLVALYALIWNFPAIWWVWAWIGFMFFSFGMGKLFPILIVPLFYKYGRVQNQDLVQRILSMGARYGLPIENVFSLNLSKTTKKANAAFMGLGKTRRVVLSDTLLENFSSDEIETVVAHELGHFKHGDIWKQLFMGGILSFVAFWIAAHLVPGIAEVFQMEGISSVGTMPLLFLVFYGVYLIFTPLQNGFSRWMERAADRFSLEAFPKPSVFISCMEKLASVNLADPNPHPLYEWFFYDHPAIAKRIEMARKWKMVLIILTLGLCSSFSVLKASTGESEKESNIEKRQKLEIMSFFAKPPGAAAVPSAPISVGLYNQAVDYYKKREFDLARQLVTEALRIDKDNSYGYELLGEINYVQQNLKEAKDNFEIAYALQPRPDVKAKIEKITKETKVESKLSTYSEEHFLIKYHDESRQIEGFELRELLREVYRGISQDFAHYPKHQIVVLLYEEKEFAQITNRPHWSAGLYDGKVRMPLKKGSLLDAELKALARHEVTHAFVATMSANDVPAWLNEGLAVYQESKERKVDLTVFRSAVKTKTLYPLAVLMSQKQLEKMKDVLAISLFYQQSYQLISYLINRYGMFYVKQMILEFSKNFSSDEVIDRILHLSVERLEQDWLNSFSPKP